MNVTHSFLYKTSTFKCSCCGPEINKIKSFSNHSFLFILLQNRSPSGAYLCFIDNQVCLFANLAYCFCQSLILNIFELNAREDILGQSIKPDTVREGQLGQGVDSQSLDHQLGLQSTIYLACSRRKSRKQFFVQQKKECLYAKF